MTIKVNEVCNYAIFEQDGIKLREAILSQLDKKEQIVLDFENIQFFATMFFNASIGWLVLRYGPEWINEKISKINLSDLGETTWKHSFDNAVQIRQDPAYKEAVAHFGDEDESAGA